METKPANFWWLKSKSVDNNPNNNTNIEDKTPSRSSSAAASRLDLDISQSLSELLAQENGKSGNEESDVDVGSILEEISRVAAQSPLGPFERSLGDRSVDDLMKEAERIYMESSKSFEQLSQLSKTSQSVSSIDNSTPTPKSVSPLPLDEIKSILEDPKDSASDKKGSQRSNSESSDDYSEDFSVESSNSNRSPEIDKISEKNTKITNKSTTSSSGRNSVIEQKPKQMDEVVTSGFLSDLENAEPNLQNIESNNNIDLMERVNRKEDEIKTAESGERFQQEFYKTIAAHSGKIEKFEQEMIFKDNLIKTLEADNKTLRNDIRNVKLELQRTNTLLDKTKLDLKTRSASSPELNLELERALEKLKDSQEINTALQLQLDTLNKSHQHLRNSYEDLLNSNKNLEYRVAELDTTLSRYKSELLNAQQVRDKLLENEQNLNKLLDVEKMQNKSLKLQNDKDAKCMQDLNRQIKEMERIIARKHPDSVSALIVAAKNDASDSNLTARKVLEDRIKVLEQEALNRDSQSSKVFLDIQDKFNQMKLKYESHIEDLELHVNDLKSQLKQKKIDTFDIYTQTQTMDEQKYPEKDTTTISTQTDNNNKVNKIPKKVEKEDTHLLATIRGLQTDLNNKDKVLVKIQKELDEIRKTNRRLQKEREGSLKNLSERKEFRSYPEKLSSKATNHESIEEELKIVKCERDKLKQQLCRLESDYQSLKEKRLQDLNVLQEAHEQELSNYISNITPLREQLEVQQVTIASLQSQLTSTKEELAIVSVERDHLNNRFLNNDIKIDSNIYNENDVEELQKKATYWEKRYEEREHRLRAIVHGLAQKNVSNRSCEQCADRQQQLIGYKMELDQILATVRALK